MDVHWGRLSRPLDAKVPQERAGSFWLRQALVEIQWLISGCLEPQSYCALHLTRVKPTKWRILPKQQVMAARPPERNHASDTCRSQSTAPTRAWRNPSCNLRMALCHHSCKRKRAKHPAGLVTWGPPLRGTEKGLFQEQCSTHLGVSHFEATALDSTPLHTDRPR